ncbi:AraC family transcriptional regulator [Roseivirga pacifica]|uniref:Transcriptional regulator, AraC family n=1 Tax=Roseivirga pacifica TaxID=1267423 RepID=A0A1I0M5K6_9BACT|nr:response regulator transcription factor [Roseivirga pacifica]RKQ50076.1 AraC family transcriptional regulator [Roseivirga pacifica]SEV83418.1 transcriptional regulator, AraC family [Roseivirga pacifica]
MAIKTERSVSDFNSELKLRGFNVFQIESDGNATRTYSRKDFYKICLTTGKSVIHYADRGFEQEGTVLFFGNPHIPYSWETISTSYVGYTVLFSEDFLHLSERSEVLQKSPLFKIGGTPILEITTTQRAFLNTIFQKMIEEQQSEYLHKDEVIRNYIHLILHEAMKLQPAQNQNSEGNAAARLTNVFLELLERQFPIETASDPLKLTSAQHYADQLSVHVNYLNRAIKEVTGRPTSSHIAERIITEAKAMLQHTNWNISEIAYALGFEYPTYFNNFFKRQTGQTPKEARSLVV